MSEDNLPSELTARAAELANGLIKPAVGKFTPGEARDLGTISINYDQEITPGVKLVAKTAIKKAIKEKGDEFVSVILKHGIKQ